MGELEQDITKIMKEIHESTTNDYYAFGMTLEETGVLDSKVGGYPYLPKGDALPENSEGVPLRFLAQVNVGHLLGGIFPHSMGILQFWLTDDDCYGVDFDDQGNQDNFRVIFYPRVKEPYTIAEMEEKFPSLLSEVEYSLPIDPSVCFKLTASKATGHITTDDFHFDSQLMEKYKELHPDTTVKKVFELTSEMDEAVFDALWYDEEAGHKLLGYPNFTQADPRPHSIPENYILLFQLDSDSIDNDEILWGDCGIGNWFIAPEDLEQGDFSKVMFNWDCC